MLLLMPGIVGHLSHAEHKLPWLNSCGDTTSEQGDYTKNLDFVAKPTGLYAGIKSASIIYTTPESGDLLSILVYALS